MGVFPGVSRGSTTSDARYLVTGVEKFAPNLWPEVLVCARKYGREEEPAVSGQIPRSTQGYGAAPIFRQREHWTLVELIPGAARPAGPQSRVIWPPRSQITLPQQGKFGAYNVNHHIRAAAVPRSQPFPVCRHPKGQKEDGMLAPALSV